MTFNGVPVKINNLEYTNVNNVCDTINKKGFCIVENVLNFEFDYNDDGSNSYEKIFFIYDKNFNIFKDFLQNTSIYNELKKLGELSLIDFRYRSKKNNSCTSIHTDKYSLAHVIFRANYLICWSPLNNIALNEGPLFFIENKNDAADISTENNVLLNNKKAIYNKPYNGSIKKIFLDYKKFESFMEERVYCSNFLEKNKNNIFSKNLKKGDLFIFNKHAIHGALDCIEGTRKSIDFRIGINLKKQESCNFINKYSMNELIDDSSSTRNVFDYNIFKLMAN